MKTIITKQSGFTLSEVMLAIIILGTIVGLATARYSTAIEKTKSAEGIQTLRTIMEAQHIHQLKNGSYASKINDLVVDIPNNFENFKKPRLSGCGGASLACIQRKDSYTLKIDDVGVITCSDGSGPSGICAKIGF